MKRTILFIILLISLSAVSGYLMSKASWVGRVGMTFFYKQYNLLKIWWQGAVAVFIVAMLLYSVHVILQKKLPFTRAKFVHMILLIAAVAGLFYTHIDFSENFSHRILGRRFHYGFYIAWIEWMLICLFFILTKKRSKIVITNSDKTEITNP